MGTRVTEKENEYSWMRTSTARLNANSFIECITQSLGFRFFASEKKLHRCFVSYIMCIYFFIYIFTIYMYTNIKKILVPLRFFFFFLLLSLLFQFCLTPLIIHVFFFHSRAFLSFICPAITAIE